MKLPYKFRSNQKQIVTRIESALEGGNHIVLEAPTGSGKTFCSLAAVLPIAIKNDFRVVYCVRTNSQQNQVVHELNQFKKKGNKISAVAIQGRDSLCPQQKFDSELEKSNWSEKSKICKSLKSQSKVKEAGCPFYRKILVGGQDYLNNWQSKVLTAQELNIEAEEAGVCPYELNKLLLKKARVVIVPYVYFFDEFVRKYLLSWMGISIDRVITIIDEAHNLPEWARNAASESMTVDSIKKAVIESNKYGLQLGDGKDIAFFLNLVEAAIEQLSEYHISDMDEEGLLPSHIISPDSEVPTFETEMMSLGRLTLYQLKKYSSEIAKIGQLVRQELLNQGKRPRSYLGSVGDYLCRWLDSVENHTIRLIGKGPLRLEKVCLDPRVMTGFLESTAGAVSMSGTISPLDMFRDLVGLRPNTVLEKQLSTFPIENMKIVYLQDVTTSYNELQKHPEIWDKMIENLQIICSSFGGNIALFFPSYKLLNLAMDVLRLKKPLYQEYLGMEQDELINTVETFKSDRGAVLAGVMGGRLSEGIDYPDTTLEMAVIVGIPYPAPGIRQEALQHYYDIVFDGRGWEFTVESPAARKILQAAGRVIRSKTDKGFVIVADNRVGRLSHYIPEIKTSTDITVDIAEFFDA